MFCDLCFNFNLFFIDANVFFESLGFYRAPQFITSHHLAWSTSWKPFKTCLHIYAFPVINLNLCLLSFTFLSYVWILNLSLHEYSNVDENACSYSSITYIVSAQRCLQVWFDLFPLSSTIILFICFVKLNLDLFFFLSLVSWYSAKLC